LGLAAASLLSLTGCSNDSDTFGGSSAAPLQPSPVPPSGTLAITPNNAAAVASATLFAGSVDALVPVDAAGPPGSEGLPAVGDLPNSDALALALAAVVNGPGTVQSPLGGSFTVGADGRVQFSDLRTPHGVVNGSLTLSGGTGDTAVEFAGVTVTTPVTTVTLRGPARLSVRPSANDRFQVVWTSNLQLRDSQGAMVQHLNLVSDSVIQLSAGNTTASETSTLTGGLDFTRRNGLTGSVVVATSKPLQLSGPVRNFAGRLTVDSGELSFNNGQMLATVETPGNVTLRVGSTVVKSASLNYFGGSQELRYALRPTLADRIFTGGRVLTMNDANPRTDGLAVMDGRIIALGATEAERYRASFTETVALNGRTLLPGFVEPHMHINLTALQRSSTINTKVVACGSEALGNSLAAVNTTLTTAVRNNPTAKAIYGYNFDPSRLIPSELMQNLTRQQLDAISSTIPIVVQNASQHISYCNTPALKASGIWPSAPNPPFNAPGGQTQFYPVDASGLPTGQLNEFAQTDAIKLAIAGVFDTDAEKLAFLGQWRQVLNDLAKVGVTSACDMLTGSFLGVDGEAAVFAGMEAEPSTPVRLRAYLDSTATNTTQLKIHAGEGNNRLRFIGAKFVTDGSTQGLTAGLILPYIFPGPFPVSPTGLLDFPSAAVLASTIQPWAALGFQPAIHANGDAALEQTFTALQMVAGSVPNADPRFRIEHFTVHQTSQLAQHIQTAKSLGCVIGNTIGHVFFWGQVFNNTLLGAPISQNIDPIASCLAAGVPVATHSDSPVTTPNPLRNVQVCVERQWQAPPVQVLGPQERVTVPQALKTVTSNAAFSCYFDKEVGSLELGKLGDFVVLSEDPTAVAPAQIAGIPVVATYLEGRRVSGSP